MPIRFRKSMKIAPGVRLTAGKKSGSLRFGPRGAGYTVSTSGRRTKSVGIPGTGISFTETSSGGKNRTSKASQPPAAAPTTIDRPTLERAIPKTGWLSSKAEKEFRSGAIDFLIGDAEEAIARLRASLAAKRTAGAELILAYALFKVDRGDEARPLLESLLARGENLPDQMIVKYLSNLQFALTTDITPEVAADLGPDLGSVTLALAEVYQSAGDVDDAIELLEGAGFSGLDESVASLSLAELYAETSRWQDVLRLTDDISNKDDASVARLVYRARAFREQGLLDAALEMNKAALRSKKRNPVVLRAARYDRAMTYGALGNKRMWRKDLEQIHAEDRSYADVAQLLVADP